MRKAFGLALLGLCVLSANALGQDKAAPAQPVQRPPELAVAPNALHTMPGSADGGAGPVNICRELVDFLQRQAAMPHPAAQDGQGGQAASGPGDTRPVPGQTAPNVDKPQHQSGLVGPVPPGEAGFKPGPVTLAQAQDYAGRNDLRACCDAAQRMRRAGTTMPDSLIALAALRPDLLEAGRGGQ